MKILGIIVLILVVIAGGYFFLLGDKDDIEISDLDDDTSIEVPAPDSTGVEETVVNTNNTPAGGGAPTENGASGETTGSTPANTTTTPAPEPITQEPEPEPTTPEPEPATPKTVTVDYSSSGYSPKSVTISKGDTVRFTNTSGQANWPASAFHPTHTVYPGSNISKCDTSAKIFDACKVLSQGESFEFTFNEVGDWKYHNHVSAGRTGTVIVK